MQQLQTRVVHALWYNANARVGAPSAAWAAPARIGISLRRLAWGGHTGGPISLCASKDTCMHSKRFAARSDQIIWSHCHWSSKPYVQLRPCVPQLCEGLCLPDQLHPWAALLPPEAEDLPQRVCPAPCPGHTGSQHCICQSSGDLL